MLCSPIPARSKSLAGLLVACVLGLAGCDLVFPEQEVHLRYDPDTDTLDMLLVYRGLTTPTGDARAIEKGMTALERLSAGAREFMIVEWPLYFALDAWVEQATEGLADEGMEEADRAIAEGLLEVAGQVALVSHGLFLDERQRLSGYQWFRVSRAREVQAVLNRMISRAVVAEVADDGEAGEPGSRAARALVARAKGGEPWFRLDTEGLTVDLPVPLDVSREQRRELFHELTETADEVFVDLAGVAFAALSELTFEQDRIVARFGPQRGGDGQPLWFHLQVRNPKASYSDAFADAWRGQQPDSLAELSIDEVRALLE